MPLPPNDAKTFFELYQLLMFFVNQRLRVLPDALITPEDFAVLAPQIRVQVRDAFLKNMDLIDPFIAQNPAHLSDNKLDIVQSCNRLWRNGSHSTF